MIKKLLKQIFKLLSYDHERRKIEKYLAGSSDLADLENRMKELDRSGAYNKYYI